MDSNDPSVIARTGDVVHLKGAWILPRLTDREAALDAFRWPDEAIRIDLSGVEQLDSGGAWLIQRTARQLRERGWVVSLTGASPHAEPLLEAIGDLAGRGLQVPAPPTPHRLEQVGAATRGQLQEYLGQLAFLGELAAASLPLLWRPARVRWRMVIHEIAEAGYRAIPIVGLLSFLLGVVIAYQGGVQLRQYGADVFIADLVGFSMLRELSPLITAIIVAGRTGSAYAAQIGTMKVTEEVNALRATGVQPLEMLVLPKFIALIVALTLLTVFADLMGLLGGMAIANAVLGISPVVFVDRVLYAVSLASYLIGIGKAPVFAAIIAWIGCYQGFRVIGSAEDVGRRTTLSVVQAIFLVIVVDAAFSVVFSELEI